MNKKTKLAIPFAVLALTCGIAAGCGGCIGGHEHSYTQWAYNEAQHWKECPDDHEKDDGTIANHVFVDGKCECGATEQTPPVTDVTITNGTTDTNGTVTLNKTTAKTGDSVTVTVAPSDGYQLKSLTVNGVNVFGVMTGNTYEFTVSEDTTVIGVFEKIASSSINAQITGKKYGVTGNSLAAGTTVTLSAESREDVTATIGADGKIQVAEIAGDNWKVKVDGYVAAEIVIPRDAEYTTAISLEYDLMENLSVSWGNYDSQDLSSQNEGKVTHSSGYYQWVSSKDSYGSVAITATVVKGGYRQGVFIRFKGDTYANDGFVMLEKENQEKICICGAGDGYTGNNLWKDNWDEYLKPLAKDEYELTLVRDGANIYIFVDGEYKATKTLPSGYADKECYVGLFCTNATTMENSERTFKIENASAFLDVTVTDETEEDAHGTVTIDKTTAKLYDTVTVTLAPDTGYKIKDLKIDGVSVLDQIQNNAYAFTILKDATVVAEFEEAKTVDSVELTVTAASGFTVDGTEITLEQLGEKWTGTVQNGTVTLGDAENPVALGTLNVTANFGGYQIKCGTVKITLPAEGTTATAQVTLGFTGSGIEYDGAVSSANPATGELTYKLGNANNGAYNNKYDIADIEGGGYFATKVKFTNDGSLTIILRRSSDNKEIKYVVQNNNAQGKGDGSNFVFGLDDDGIANGIWDSGAFVSLAAYNEAFKGDGVWIVLGYDAATGELTSYIGTSLESMRPLKTLQNITSGLTINGFGVGNWFSSISNTVTASVTLKYGKTMADIGMAIEEKVTVTASVNDATMGSVALDVTDGKYFSNTQVKVTVTANAGYVLKSIKVGDTVVETGWTTDGNVYTYTFTAPEGGAMVVATLEELAVWDTATLTLNGVAENTAVKLSDGVDTITATVGANGVITFTGDNAIGKKAYTVTVVNVVFDVDFTTVSAVRKTIATVTADNFTAKDNFNEGAKVIDMGAAKNSTEYSVTFNLKTTSTAAGWQQRWALLLINGGDNTTTGIGCIGKNDDQLLVWAAYAASPDDKEPTKYSEAKYLKFDELVHSANGVNMKVVRHGSKATMYFELDGEWIEMLSVTLGSGETNLRFSCSYSVEWQLSDIAIDYISEFDYLVNASIEGDAHGYKVSVEQTANGATVVIQTDNANDAWGYFPNAVTVNGTAIDFSTVTKESLGANRCKYTFVLENITENTDIVVTVGAGTKVAYNASVNDAEMGSIVCDMQVAWGSTEYYWNDLCTFTVTANDGYELESLVIGEGESAITITKDSENGWTQNGNVYTYNYLVTDDIKVVANFAKIPYVTLNNVTVNITDGTNKIDLGESVSAKLDGDTDYSVTLTKGEDGAYTFGGTFLRGNYKLIISGQNVGYSPVDVAINEDTATVSVQYVLATATKYHHGDNNGMGECDFETLIAIDANTVNINTASANGKTVDNFWCWNSPVPEVTLNVSDEVKNATNVTLEFNLKVTNGNNGPNNAFGIAIAGYKGVAISLWNINDNKIDLHELTGCKLGADGWGYADTYASYGWIETLAESAGGVNIRVVREGATITFYAQNTAITDGDQWVKFFETTCDESAKTDIKFLGMGSDYTVSAITVTINETNSIA